VRKQIEVPGRIVQDIPLPFDFARRDSDGPPRELVLLLHGHGETGRKILDLLGPALPRQAVVIAPNAPFPIVEWIGSDWKKRQTKFTYCWHFYDPASDAYFISPETGLAHLAKGLSALGVDHLPKRIIGFSQGGYVAQYAAQRLSRVSHLIAIGCEFLPDEIADDSPFRIDGIFGEKDRILNPNAALKTHAEASRRGRGGEIHAVPGLGHEIDVKVVTRVGELLQATAISPT
jgi:predicted esterase